MSWPQDHGWTARPDCIVVLSGPMVFVLASASPRRRELLEAAGFIFDVSPVEIDEARLPAEPPFEYVERVARAKADVAARHHPGRLVVAADTSVVLDGEVFGKPRDAQDAARMLRALSGRAHDVMTGVAVAEDRHSDAFVERTTVWFRELSARDIADYVASGEPFDKAGAYAIQGRASRFIPRIHGSYSNVVGLPVAPLSELLVNWGAHERNDVHPKGTKN